MRVKTATDERDGLQYRHAVCATQALLRPQPRVGVCGHNSVGVADARVTRSKPPCPDCVALVDAHRANCDACLERGWEPGDWPTS